MYSVSLILIIYVWLPNTTVK